VRAAINSAPLARVEVYPSWDRSASSSRIATILSHALNHGSARQGAPAISGSDQGRNQSTIYQRSVQLEKRVDLGRVSSHPALITSSRAARAGARGLSGVTGTQAIPTSSACWPPSSKRTDSEGLTPCASNHE
jgi:hypothetical protein